MARMRRTRRRRSRPRRPWRSRRAGPPRMVIPIPVYRPVTAAQIIGVAVPFVIDSAGVVGRRSLLLRLLLRIGDALVGRLGGLLRVRGGGSVVQREFAVDIQIDIEQLPRRLQRIAENRQLVFPAQPRLQPGRVDETGPRPPFGQLHIVDHDHTGQLLAGALVLQHPDHRAVPGRFDGADGHRAAAGGEHVIEIVRIDFDVLSGQPAFDAAADPGEFFLLRLLPRRQRCKVLGSAARKIDVLIFFNSGLILRRRFRVIVELLLKLRRQLGQVEAFQGHMPVFHIADVDHRRRQLFHRGFGKHLSVPGPDLHRRPFIREQRSGRRHECNDSGRIFHFEPPDSSDFKTDYNRFSGNIKGICRKLRFLRRQKGGFQPERRRFSRDGPEPRRDGAAEFQLGKMYQPPLIRLQPAGRRIRRP